MEIKMVLKYVADEQAGMITVEFSWGPGIFKEYNRDPPCKLGFC